MRRSGSPFTGVGIVLAKEAADQLSGVRMVRDRGAGFSDCPRAGVVFHDGDPRIDRPEPVSVSPAADDGARPDTVLVHRHGRAGGAGHCDRVGLRCGERGVQPADLEPDPGAADLSRRVCCSENSSRVSSPWRSRCCRCGCWSWGSASCASGCRRAARNWSGCWGFSSRPSPMAACGSPWPFLFSILFRAPATAAHSPHWASGSVFCVFLVADHQAARRDPDRRTSQRTSSAPTSPTFKPRRRSIGSRPTRSTPRSRWPCCSRRPAPSVRCSSASSAGIARRPVAGDAELYPGLAAADRAHRGDDPDLCGLATSSSSARRSARVTDGRPAEDQARRGPG